MTEKLSDEKFSEVAEHYRQICARLEEAKRRAGRSDEVRLMAVTKTVAPEIVNYAVSLGISLLGENRVQEYLEKRDRYAPGCEVHFIGGLQTNKVKYIIDKVRMIHSVDSGKLAAEISRRAAAAGTVMDILFEINIGGEESKNGIPPEELRRLAEETAALPNLRIRGLMTIPPVDRDGSSERYFEKMKRIYEDFRTGCSGEKNFRVDTLSMGMSGDFETAVQYGSTIVRIGSLLFGYRKY